MIVGAVMYPLPPETTVMLPMESVRLTLTTEPSSSVIVSGYASHDDSPPYPSTVNSAPEPIVPSLLPDGYWLAAAAGPNVGVTQTISVLEM